jgi:hypothetical protein
MDKFLAKYSWKLEYNVVTTAEVKEPLETYDFKEEIEFQNSMTSYLENITRANLSLKLPKTQETK